MTHICVGNLTIIGPDNGLSPGQCQAIIWTNAGMLLIGLCGTNFSDILIGIHTFSFKKIHLKMSSAKWRPFCLGLNVLILCWSKCLMSYGITKPQWVDNPQSQKYMKSQNFENDIQHFHCDFTLRNAQIYFYNPCFICLKTYFTLYLENLKLKALR